MHSQHAAQGMLHKACCKDMLLHASSSGSSLVYQPMQQSSPPECSDWINFVSTSPDTIFCLSTCNLSTVQVMNNKQNRQMLTFIGGFAVVLLLVYYLFF
jgi:hypothetical protein